MCETCGIESDFKKIAALIFYSVGFIVTLIAIASLLVEKYSTKDYYKDKEGYYRMKKKTKLNERKTK